MLGYKHARFFSLQPVQKSSPPPPPESLEGSTRYESVALQLEETPKMITCAMQPLASVLQATEQPSPVASETTSSSNNFTLEDFLSPAQSKVFNRSIRKIPVQRRILGRMKESMNVRTSALHEYRRLAAAQDSKYDTRRSAAIRIQRWYRRITSHLQSRLRSQLQCIREKHAARLIATAIRDFSDRRKNAKERLTRKFVHHCVVLIQKVWRGYTERRRISENRKRARDTAAAWVLGWRCRRVMHCRSVLDLKTQIKSAVGKLQRKRLIEELISLLDTLTTGGCWVRKTKSSENRLKRKVRTESLQTEPSLRALSPELVPPLGDKKLRRKPFHSSSICQTEGSVTSAEDNFPFQTPPRPYLKRKSSITPPRTICWSHVKCKVECWSSPPQSEVNNSLLEFLRIEKSVEQEETVPTRALPPFPQKTRKSRIPCLSDCSSFIASLKKIDQTHTMREIRDLLQQEFQVLL